MNLQIMCIYGGLPLWLSSYPQTSMDNNTLISGFLSAVNMFAKQTSGKMITNMTLENFLWSFVNLYDTEDLFIASQIDLSGDVDEKQYKIRAMDLLILEIISEFQKEFPKEKIFENRPVEHPFATFQNYVNAKVSEYIEILSRYSKRDIRWLAEFIGSEKLITAIMNRTPIFIISNNIEEIKNSEDYTKLIATFEYIFGSPIKKIHGITPDQLINIHELDLAGKIFLLDAQMVTPFLSNGYTVVDFLAKNILKGPDSNTIAKNIINYVRKTNTRDILNSNLISEKILSKNPLEIENLINKSSSMKTEFQCKLCQSIIQININDESTYLAKNEHQSFFGMDLTTYKVAHFKEDKIHINSILVDKKGLFHGLIEGYAIKIKDYGKKDQIKNTNLIILSKDEQPLRNHAIIDNMFVINQDSFWIMEIISSSMIKPIEFGNLLLEKIHEIFRVYTQPNSFLSVIIADKKYYFWYSNPIIIVLSFKSAEILDIIEPIVKKLLNQKYRDDEWLSRREKFNIALKFMETVKVNKSDIPIIERILFDDLLFSYINLKYPEQKSRIIERLSKEFLIAHDVLESLFNKRSTIMDLVKGNYLAKTRDLIELVEFVNRRNILA